jgi:2-hydroxychromene-2-carboxylate isomerase
MKTLDFWFDPISPYAWLAFDALPDALQGLNVQVNYRPVLFAGLLAHWGQKGPAEIEPKRLWTYQDVAWRAHQQGLALAMPAQHPFNPLTLLRLALACCPAGGTPNRWVVEAIFKHVWQGGHDAADPTRLAQLQAHLQPQRDPADAAVKQELKANTEQAIALGVFGVPTVVAGGLPFWGADGLGMLAANLRGDPWFAGPQWREAQRARPGLSRR